MLCIGFRGHVDKNYHIKQSKYRVFNNSIVQYIYSIYFWILATILKMEIFNEVDQAYVEIEPALVLGGKRSL